MIRFNVEKLVFHKSPTVYVSREKWTYKMGRECNIFFIVAISSASLYTLEAASKFPWQCWNTKTHNLLVYFKAAYWVKFSFWMVKEWITDQTLFHVCFHFSIFHKIGIWFCFTLQKRGTGPKHISYLLLKPGIEKMDHWHSLQRTYEEGHKHLQSCIKESSQSILWKPAIKQVSVFHYPVL